MNDGNAKQQIVDRIKNVTNILVTLSKNPNVDELSAALGLTLMLNKLDKHATAVFSGQVPPAIEFLEPSKTFENTVDSLRDFIIALDKEKADRLRYRVEDDMVRIFITPYRTRITEDDLKFTHGDFNVELVLALGVEKQEDLDEAIAAHGKILHDAVVATISTGMKKSNLGSIDWQDASASSLCEMLVAISESLKNGILDEQISTALLTGIVAATDRFSNSQTSPKSMTMAAQLMAAGANQQLIAAKLEESQEISAPPLPPAPDGSQPLDEGMSQKLRGADSQKPAGEEVSEPDAVAVPDDGSLGQMKIEHTAPPKTETDTPKTPEIAPEPKPKPAPKKANTSPPILPQVPHVTIEEHTKRHRRISGEEALDEALAELGSDTDNEPTVSEASVHDELAKTANDTALDSEPELSYIETGHDQDRIGDVKPSGQWKANAIEEPSMGGALSATAEEAEEARRHEEESKRNRVIMTHDKNRSPQGKTITPPSSATSAPQTPAVAPAAPASQPGVQPSTISNIESQVKDLTAPASPSADHPDAVRQEIDSIFGASPTAPPPSSGGSLLPPPPPLPDFSNLPPLPPDNGIGPPIASAAPLANLMPGGEAPTAAPPPTLDTQPAPVANPSDPTQFHIPGQ